VRSFLHLERVFWLEKFHADGLRVDGVASMLYLDYSRKAGEWMPNEYGGRENLEAIAFLRSLNDTVYASTPTCRPSPRSRPPGPWSRARLPRRPGLRHEVGHGLDARHPAYLGRTPSTALPSPRRADLPMMYAFSENFVLPLSHDEVVHGKGSLLGKMPGDRWQKFANLRLLLGYQWPSPARSCCSWAASSASGASGTTTPSSTGTSRTAMNRPPHQREER
jgi:1,4-alpha-glucan branching enzyme